jgi:hypothetical protein
MRSFALLLTLAAPLRAQTAALPPAPAPAAEVPADDAKLDELFRRFTSGRPMIPTLKEVQAEQSRRDLAPRPDEGGSAAAGSHAGFGFGNQPPLANERKATRESVDVAVSRPLPRAELGVGYSEANLYAGSLRLEHDVSKYAFLRIDLSKSPLPRKLFHSPTAVRVETEVGERVRVSSDDYSIRSLPRP